MTGGCSWSGERSGRLASLAGVDAGFDEVSAFEIDAAEGDLWVVERVEPVAHRRRCTSCS